ncbi:MAG: trimethylamine methyltransferase, partial [Planctomycetes bacterium]|nr:trimethylamine methyltransferase [Planctomycetota bacterium]
EIWFPKLLDRSFYQAWVDGGASGMEERCRKRKDEILRRHSPEPISADIARALDEVVEAARRGLSRR